MAKLRDKLWLWGQSPDAHWEINNKYNLPGHSRMTAVEGALYFDIPNMCRIKMMGSPVPPYDQESIAMTPCKKVVWSLLGAGGEPVTEWGDMEEVAAQARKFPNVVGGVFDDFFLEKRIKYYTPEKLQEIKDKMNARSGKKMDMWVVCYEDKLETVENIEKYFDKFDVITFWTWKGSELVRAEKNFARIKELAPGKRIMAGCYMWNYGETKPLTGEEMRCQTDLYLKLLKNKTIDGIIICSNCIADLGIEAVDWMKQWIKEHKNDEIAD